MQSSRIPSPSRSQGARSTPRRYRPRSSRSVGSPARSTTSLKLSTVIQMESLVVSPMPSRRSVLIDTTLVHTPARKSWWKKLDENSREIMEVLNSQEPAEPNNAIVEYIEVDVLSQEKKNYTLDMPESSDGESITSIVIPQRKLFTQKEKQPRDKFGQIIDGRESLAKLHKSQADVDKSLNVNPKNLFNLGTKQKRKPIFPSALLNVSVNKTITNKTKELATNEDHGQVKSLFGNRAGTKRKNMFADFIVSESEDDISEIQPKIFGFQKKLEQKRRASLQNRNGREPSPSSITDIEMDNWELLPSSTMVDHQLEDGLKTTPSKRSRLSKISDATNHVNPLNTSKNRTKLLNSKNKSIHSSSKFKEIEVDKLIEPLSSGDELDAGNVEAVRRINTSNKNISLEKHLLDQSLKNHKHNKSKNTRTTQNATAICDEITDSSKSKLHKTKVNEKSISKIDQALESDDEDDFTLKYENDDNEQNVQEIKENETIVENENHKQQSFAPNSSISKQQQKRISKSQSDVHNKSQKVNKNEDLDTQPQNISLKMSQRDQSKLSVNVSYNKKQSVDISKSDYQNQSISQVHSNDKKNNSKSNKKNRSALEVHDSSKITEMQNVNKNISRQEFTEKKDIEDEQNDDEAHITEDSNSESNNENEAVRNSSEAAVSVEEEPQNESEEASNVEDEEETEKNTESENDSDNEEDEDQENENEDQEMYHQDEEQMEKNNSNVKLNQSKDVQGESLNEVDEIMESDDNQSDKTNRTYNRKKGLNITKDANEENRNDEPTVPSPEVPVLQNKMNEMESFTVKGRNTSARKTKSMIKSLNIRPSLEPVRENSDLSNGTKNSSAEGSGWDSHRTTRKTLRKTFGKDFSLRKSLRTLVMEKSTKRQTEFTVTNAEISNFPQANSTELPNPELYMVEDEVDGGQESDVLEPQDAEPLDMDDAPDDVQETDEQEAQNTESDMDEVEADDDVQESDVQDPQNAESSNMEEDGGSDNDDVQDSDVQEPQNSDVQQDVQESEVEESRNTEAQIDEDEDDNDVHESEVEESRNTEAEIDEDEDDNDVQESEVEESRNNAGDMEEEEDVQESDVHESRNTEADIDEDEADDDVQDSDAQEPQDNEAFDMDEDEADDNLQASEVHEMQDSERFDEDKDEEADMHSSYDQEPHHTEPFDMNEAEADDDVEVSNVQKTLETKRETPMKKRQTTLVMYLQNIKNKNIERKKQLEHEIRSTLNAPTRDIFNPFKVPAIPKQRRTKVQSKPKPKPKASMFPMDLLPTELLEDMKYKPPKRYRPPNASWITKRLYKFLETKLEPKYDYKARVRSEKLVEKLYEFTKVIRRHTTAPQETVVELKHEMARLGIVTTHFEFNQFFHDYMPREVRVKVVPDAFNNIPEPKHGIFSNILR